MMLIEQTQVADAALPIAAFRDHLQLGSGFADDGLQDAVLVPLLKAAIAYVEAETGKALFQRTFQYVLTAWRDHQSIALPRAPLISAQSLSITDLAGGTEIIGASRYAVVQDDHHPRLCTTGWSLPTIPVGGTAEILFDAGFGAAWDAVTPDLAQAVMLLAAHYYENRSAVGKRQISLPLGVAELLKGQKSMRLFGGLRAWA